jgi:hypothetical protein
LVVGFRTWRGEQLDVPTGGRTGAWSGAIEGGAIAQTSGAQIGGKSMELSHNGSTSPSTQRHTQEASAFTNRRRLKTQPSKSRMSPPPEFALLATRWHQR